MKNLLRVLFAMTVMMTTVSFAQGTINGDEIEYNDAGSIESDFISDGVDVGDVNNNGFTNNGNFATSSGQWELTFDFSNATNGFDFDPTDSVTIKINGDVNGSGTGSWNNFSVNGITHDDGMLGTGEITLRFLLIDNKVSFTVDNLTGNADFNITEMIIKHNDTSGNGNGGNVGGTTTETNASETTLTASNGTLNVTTDMENFNIQIINLNGQLLLDENSNSNSTFNVDNLPTGMYIVRVTDSSTNDTMTQTVVL
jgi:hypothetical protein